MLLASLEELGLDVIVDSCSPIDASEEVCDLPNSASISELSVTTPAAGAPCEETERTYDRGLRAISLAVELKADKDRVMPSDTAAGGLLIDADDGDSLGAAEGRG